MQTVVRWSRGFTLIEIMITLVVMVILLGLGVVGVGTLQAQARDAERKSDIESIARGFEQRYKQGNTAFKFTEVDNWWFIGGARTAIGQGSYPGVFEIQYAYGNSKGEFDPSSLPNSGDGSTIAKTYDIPVSALRSPGQNLLKLICESSCQKAENATQIDNSFKTSGAYVDRYVYEPIDGDGDICSISFNFKRCTRFNLYWRDESGTIQKYESKKWQ